mmetsp:Transcript_58932/g.164669  ORF Transcript_58932/g.164669 Transcript_58932/m.164669 type:complete len:315 (+) Transcript_58932:368-1312(+)
MRVSAVHMVDKHGLTTINTNAESRSVLEFHSRPPSEDVPHLIRYLALDLAVQVKVNLVEVAHMVVSVAPPNLGVLHHGPLLPLPEGQQGILQLAREVHPQVPRPRRQARHARNVGGVHMVESLAHRTATRLPFIGEAISLRVPGGPLLARDASGTTPLRGTALWLTRLFQVADERFEFRRTGDLLARLQHDMFVGFRHGMFHQQRRPWRVRIEKAEDVADKCVVDIGLTSRYPALLLASATRVHPNHLDLMLCRVGDMERRHRKTLGVGAPENVSDFRTCLRRHPAPEERNKEREQSHSKWLGARETISLGRAP